ncbi:MAG: signal peptidase I [Paludisphaera borealis]|uniref:signal peptidase I n=1 Tax=Paludisphaera borealis TaxID=1387353 RepID=UPI002848B106|nr:signal peptidase I [Paludisphaera borealis]MDR3620661.1 signal peptidase I [Paludisphaera borealis]
MGRTATATATTKTSTASSAATRRVEFRAQEGHRETVEAIIVALILALVVRGFEAQAFVIPTGSMAPTLMGRHKEVTCPQCGFVYAVNASEEVEGSPYPRQVYAGTCVNCRFQATRLDDAPSFKGDRILVSMFPYDLPFLPGASTPERWDVVVFRYPEEPEVSYIKRLVGLPGETIRIYHGDVYVKSKGADDFKLQRKTLAHQAAMQIPVYDDRHRPRATAGRDEWTRWKPETPGGWKIVEPSVSTYRCDQPTSEWVDLRYQHLVPDLEQWDALISDRTPSRRARPTLITDFYSYNTNLTAEAADLPRQLRGDSENAWLQPHWVGDLTLSASVEVASAAGELKLELIKGGVAHRSVIDLATGKAQLTRGDEALGEFETKLTKPGRYRLEFANVDDRLTLSVDGRSVVGEGIEFDRGEAPPVPTEADLAPAAAGAPNPTLALSDHFFKTDI